MIVNILIFANVHKLLIRIRSENRSKGVKLRFGYDHIAPSGFGDADQVGIDTSILHHAFISIFIALWAVITRYVTILMPILSYFTRFT